MASQYPTQLDVFMSLYDGFHPIAAADLNDYHDALEKIEDVVGHGVSSTVGGTFYGPKGQLASLKARLDAFLENDGALKNVAFVTGSVPLGQLSTAGNGLYIGFGKSLGTTDYGVIVSLVPPDDTAYNTWVNPPWVDLRLANACRLFTRANGTFQGAILGTGDTTVCRFALLAVASNY